MTKQEVIDKLRNIKLYMKIVDSQDHDLQFSNNDYTTIDIAIKAVEKQVPKKPTRIKDIKDFSGRHYCFKGECPKCGNTVGEPELYCYHCGQKLDWDISVIKNNLKE